MEYFIFALNLNLCEALQPVLFAVFSLRVLGEFFFCYLIILCFTPAHQAIIRVQKEMTAVFCVQLVLLVTQLQLHRVIAATLVLRVRTCALSVLQVVCTSLVANEAGI